MENIEPVVCKCSSKYVTLKISQISQEKHLCFCEIPKFKNFFFDRIPPFGISENVVNSQKLKRIQLKKQ